MRKLVNENQPPKQTEQTPEQIQSKRRSRLLAIKERVAPSLASKAVAAVGGVPSRQGLLGALGALATFGQDPKSNELTAAMKANFNQQYYGKKGRPDTPSEAQEKTRNKAYKKSVDDYLKLEKIVAELKKETETKRVELQDARQPLQKELDGLQRVLREYDEEIAKESDEGRKNYLAVGRAESQNELNAVLDDMTNKEKPLMQLEAECAKRLGIQQSSEADVEKAMIALESQSQALETAEAAAKKEAKGKA